jgi:hypothetical protein
LLDNGAKWETEIRSARGGYNVVAL